MKKYLAVFFAIIMILSALVGCTKTEPVTTDKTIKIGVFEPTSGYSASGGKKEVLGIKYANHLTPTVDIMGETYKIELVYADNKSDPDLAIDAANELIEAGVGVILG